MLKKLNAAVVFSGLVLTHATGAIADPWGGGPGYSGVFYPSDADIVVRTPQQLTRALANGYQSIFIQGTLTFNATRHALVIPSNVTIGSNRGQAGATPGKLRFLQPSSGCASRHIPVIKAGNNVTITGLEIQGPSTQINTRCLETGIQQSNGYGLTVENSELWGWTAAAISFKRSTGGVVEYNYIHSNRRQQRGYGVVVQNGYSQVDIRFNVFNNNRHSIAGSGQNGEVYTAQWNLVLPERNGHGFDMHKANPRANNGNSGGERVDIRNNIFDHKHNTVCYGYPAVSIREIPTSGRATITGNYFKVEQSSGNCPSNNKKFVRRVNDANGNPPNDNALVNSNSFRAHIRYRRAGSQCYVVASSMTRAVLCDAVSRYIR